MKIISYIYLILATVIWAFAPPLVKLSLNEIDPMFFLFARFLLVSIFCLPYIYLVVLKKKYTTYDWFSIFLFSLSGQVSLLIYFKGLDLTTSTDAIILSLLGPVVTMIAGHYFYGEKFNFRREMGVGIAVLGAIIVVIEPLLSQTNGTAKDRFLGNILVILSSVFGIFWVVYSKFLFGKNSIKLISIFKKIGVKLKKKNYSPVEFNILSFYIAFLVMIPFYGLNFDLYNKTFANLSFNSFWVIIYMAVLSSIFAYILYAKAQAKLDISEVSLLAYISPLFSLPAGYFILGESPSRYAIFGLIAIFIGIAIAEKSKKWYITDYEKGNSSKIKHN